MESVVATSEQKLSKFLRAKYSGLSYAAFQKLLRTRAIKINGNKVSADVMVAVGDKIEVYAPDNVLYGPKPQIVFEDDNILVANKPAGIEVCDGDGITLEKMLSGEQRVYAVHRIDRNTSGLVVFAKNMPAKAELESMFKEHRIEKYYLSQVFGTPKQKQKTLVAYLKKDSAKSLVYVTDKPKPGYDKIITEYKVKSSNGITSWLSIKLLTGKTHQIRAHLAFIGFPLVGDDKYGNKAQNSTLKKHRQMLIAYKIVFENPKNCLEYLRGKAIELDTTAFEK